MHNLMNGTEYMTSTGANTTSTPNLPSADSRLSAENIVKITMICILLVTSLVGNSLVIIVIGKTRTLRKTMNYFILNMAISDILTPMSILPVWLSWLISNDLGKWHLKGGLGAFLCKLLHFCGDLSPRVSVLSLVFMAVDRFCAVVYSMRLNMITPKVRCAMLVSTWLVAGGFAATDFYTFQLFDYDTIYCLSSWHPTLSIHVKIQQPYSLTDHIIFIFLPFILLTTLYSAILITLRRQQNVTRLMSSGKAVHQREKRSRSILKQALAIVIVFGVCFAPYSGIMIVQSLVMNWQASRLQWWIEMIFVVHFLTWLNASINPCMYFLFFSNYRKSLKQVVHGISMPTYITRTTRSIISITSRKKSEERESAVEMNVLGDCPAEEMAEDIPDDKPNPADMFSTACCIEVVKPTK